MSSQQASLWRHPDFIKLWTGQTISELGSRITRDGLPLAAVVTLGATPMQMGLLAAAGAAPVLLLGLIAGAWVDRLPRRPILIGADLGRALLLLTIPIAAIQHTLGMTQLYIVIALTGMLGVLFQVAYEAFLPSLVKREQVLEGNSKLALSGATAEVLGPSLAGLLVQALTAPIAILLDALSFLASAISVALIRKTETVGRPLYRAPHLGREIREGLQAVAGNPILRTLAGAAGISAFFGGFYATLYALYAVRELGLGPAALGAAIAFGGIGDLVGALVTHRVARQFGLGPTFAVTLAIKGVAGMLTALAGGPVWQATAMLMAAQLVGDAASAVYSINAISLRQTITPDRLLGRVNASFQIVIAGLSPLGGLTGGFLGETLGPRGTLAIAVLGSLLACGWVLVSPIRRLRESPAPAGPNAFDSTAHNA